MVEVETARLLLRPWRDEDLEPHARICADPEIMRYMGRGAMARERDAERIEGFVRHWERHGYGLWAAQDKATGALVGRIGLLHREDSPEGGDGVEVAWLLDALSGAGVSPPKARWRVSAMVSRSYSDVHEG